MSDETVLDETEVCNLFSEADADNSVTVGDLCGKFGTFSYSRCRRAVEGAWAVRRSTLSVIDFETLRKVVRKSQVVLVLKNLGWLTGMTDDGVNDTLTPAVAVHTSGHGVEPECEGCH